MISFGQQNFIPGQSYFGQNNYVEYIAGNLPIIIGVPHGGTLTPANLPVIHNRGVDNGSFETSHLLFDTDNSYEHNIHCTYHNLQ